MLSQCLILEDYVLNASSEEELGSGRHRQSLGPEQSGPALSHTSRGVTPGSSSMNQELSRHQGSREAIDPTLTSTLGPQLLVASHKPLGSSSAAVRFVAKGYSR